MFEDLKIKVCKANVDLANKGIVIYTWGNVSEVDRENNAIVIKPSGVAYDVMGPEDMVVVDLLTGDVIDGKWNPSSDTETHLALYRAFPEIGGITHTHSVNAVAYAQAGIDIPALGTTQADYFYGSIPCTRELTRREVEDAYELNTGKVIVECFNSRKINPMAIPGVVVKNHGPFAWGKDATESVYHAVVLETVAELNIKTLQLNPNASLQPYVLDKHYLRKHGPNAYYGQLKK